MDLRALGRTGLMVSPIGLGTVKFGRTEGLKYPASFSLPEDREIDALLEQARSLGVNLLDTAPAYGTSEQRLGKALRRHRENFILASKAGEYFEKGLSRFDFSGSSVQASIESSLRHLQTDRIDLVSLHSSGAGEAAANFSASFGEAFQMLAALKAKGLIRASGFSAKTLDGARLALDCCDVVMIAYNPGDQTLAPAITEARRRQVGVLIKKALASGHTADVPGALRFSLTTPGVSSVIVGTLSPHHLAEAAAIAEGVTSE